MKTLQQFKEELLEDGVIDAEEVKELQDDEEANWLYGKIIGDGQVDGLEKELLVHLKNEAKSFPENLVTLLK